MWWTIFLAVAIISGLSFTRAAPPPPPSTSADGRVVNGQDSNISQWPFMVSLRLLNGHICGGTAVSTQWILTAGHCIEPSYPLVYYTVQHSSTTISTGDAGENVIPVNQLHRHEQYNVNNLYIHDIGLLHIIEPIYLSEYAVLPPMYYEPDRSVAATLLGWGLDRTGGDVQSVLQQVDLSVFSDTECYQRLGISLHASTLCSGVPEGGKGQCTGDSGGPLVLHGEQVGIVSWSIKPCGQYPGVFTKVSHYRDWIYQITGV